MTHLRLEYVGPAAKVGSRAGHWRRSLGIGMAERPVVSFGTLLRRLRIDAGLTQEALAEAARLSYRSISDLERGVNQSPRKETARLLAEALGLTGAERIAFEAAAWGNGGTVTRQVQVPETGPVALATRTLPRDVASFTGRERELAYLVEAVTDAAVTGGVVGICAIGGMAGIGKTALAVHAAHRLAPQFPDGQIFLPLHGHTPGQRPVDPADALASLLQASGIAAQQIPAGLEPRAWLWRDRIADKRTLLVLDDAAGHEQVRPLLPGTAGSLVLITSRRHLTALEDAQVINLDILSADEAADLLVRLAARPSLHRANPPVQEISRLCGHLPLAIGMLARQLRHHPAWTAQELAADLAAARSRLELMQAENLSAAAAFDLSYRDLTADQQHMFRRLGLHPGADIDVYAAAALSESSIDAARRNLAGLYDHYLISEPSHGRYRMHDLISEHAQALAATEPAVYRDAAVDRLLEYYLQATRIASHHLVRRTRPQPHSRRDIPPSAVPDLSKSKDAGAWMHIERANLYAAANYAAAHSLSEFAVTLPAAMHGYLRHHGNWDQVLTIYRDALDQARQVGNWQAEADVLTDIGDIQMLSGNYPGAVTSLIHALEICRKHADKRGEAHALSILGYVQHQTGENRAATVNLASALKAYHNHNDRLGEASTLAYLSEVQMATGQYDEAKTGLEQALELHYDLGNRLWEAEILNLLGVVQNTIGDYKAAVSSHMRALELQREIGNRIGEAKTTCDLGSVQQANGDYLAAAASFACALEMDRDLGFRHQEAYDLGCLGAVQYLVGDYTTAAATLVHALRLYRDLGIRDGEAEVLNTLGEMCLAADTPSEGRVHHEEALTVARTIESLPNQARALEGIGRCRLRDGYSDTATEPLHEALVIYQRIGSPHAGRLRNVIRENGLDEGKAGILKYTFL
jgi:tetratricopeptide (TPR) repeat protein/transcriptional regulator with XRE-family HTH domain